MSPASAPVNRSATFECALLASCGFADVTSAASVPSSRSATISLRWLALKFSSASQLRSVILESSLVKGLLMLPPDDELPHHCSSARHSDEYSGLESRNGSRLVTTTSMPALRSSASAGDGAPPYTSLIGSVISRTDKLGTACL